MEKMYYVQTNCVRNKSILGYEYFVGLEAYRGITARNKVILRCNLSDVIVRDNYLSEENMGYADGLCKFLMGVSFKGIDLNDFFKFMSDGLKVFMSSDSKFNDKLCELYYVKYMLSSEETSFFRVLENDFRDSYEAALKRFISTIRAQGFSLIYKDGASMWYGIDDVSSNIVYHDKMFKQEVISNAKSWKCVFEASRESI